MPGNRILALLYKNNSGGGPPVPPRGRRAVGARGGAHSALAAPRSVTMIITFQVLNPPSQIPRSAPELTV
jgi:hypothetical protein